jgi:hypothetical protein
MRSSDRRDGDGNNHRHHESSSNPNYSNPNSDRFTRTHYEQRPGVGTKVKNSLSGLLMGPVFILAGCVLLWYNEAWAVQTYKSLNEGLANYTPLPDSSMIINNDHRSAYDNRLVHMSDKVTVEQPAIDSIFGLRRDAVSLTRHVELYQWVETKKTTRHKLQNGETQVDTTFQYNPKWVHDAIDSSRFAHPRGHENTGGRGSGSASPRVSFSKETFVAMGIQVGTHLYLSQILARKLTRSQTVPATAIKTIPPGGERVGDAIYFWVGGATTNTGNANANGEGDNGKPPPPQQQQPQDLHTRTEDLIERTEMVIDGKELAYFVVKATGDGFWSQDVALEAAVQAKEEVAAAKAKENERDLVEQTTMVVDGAERVLYLVKATGASFSSKEKALEAAAQAHPPRPRQATATATHPQRSANDPQIGDVRVTFTEVPCTTVSVLARLSGGNMLSPWPSKQGPGYDIGMVVYGYQTAEEMIASAHAANHVMTWVKRFVGWFLTFIGYGMITQIVTTTADITLNWVPLLGPMTTSIISLGVTIANFVLATTTSLPVAALAWVVYRPLLGIGMLTVSLGLFYAASSAGKQKNKRL